MTRKLNLQAVINRPEKINARLLFSGILTLFLFLILGKLDTSLKTEQAPYGIVSFELSGSLEKSNEILNSWTAKSKLYAALSLGIDFLFLFIYPVFFFSAIYLSAVNFAGNTPLFRAGVFLAFAQIVAGLSDAAENICLINLLFGSQKTIYPMLAFYFASVKFILIAAGIFYLFFLFMFSFYKKRKIFELKSKP